MTGSAIDEDGSHQELPYWDFFKANNFTLGALWAFSPIYFGCRGGLLWNQDKLFWKLPSPLTRTALKWHLFYSRICSGYYTGPRLSQTDQKHWAIWGSWHGYCQADEWWDIFTVKHQLSVPVPNLGILISMMSMDAVSCLSLSAIHRNFYPDMWNNGLVIKNCCKNKYPK